MSIQKLLNLAGEVTSGFFVDLHLGKQNEAHSSVHNCPGLRFGQNYNYFDQQL